MKARIQHLQLPPGRRILAISDVHGNLAYLRGALEKAGFCREDVLIFVGDIIEKGAQSLETLRYIMELQKTHTVYAVEGNCDGWQTRCLPTPNSETEQLLRKWIVHGLQSWHGRCLLAQMCDEIGFTRSEDMDLERMWDALHRAFPDEFDFLTNLPTVIETENYTFVHGGLPEGDPESWDAYACMKNDSFLTQGRKMEKWCVVGHWPVMLYGGGTTCANPIIDQEKKIISIDGGCVLKDDGQLNVLVIPHDGSEDFTHFAYDPFPVRRVKCAQAGSEKSAYIRWGDNLVRVLEPGREFSRCEHVRTGYRMDILTKFLYGQEGELWHANDCTDYMLPLSPGDEISIVEKTSRGYLCKHKGTSGWYFGELVKN